MTPKPNFLADLRTRIHQHAEQVQSVFLELGDARLNPPNPFDPRSILTAERRIRPHVAETPLLPSPVLSEQTGASVFLKLENRQTTGSFKLRGATNKLLGLSAAQRRRGIVTASTGNHGLAVAHAVSQLGVTATIFMPEDASQRKVAKLRNYDVELRFIPGDAVNAEMTARRSADETDRLFVSPYNDPEIVAGQGTVAVEMLRQQPELDAVFVSVGGGGLMGGIGSYCKDLPGFGKPGRSSPIQVVGCLPENSPVMLESVRAGCIVEMDGLPTLSDGTAGGIEADAITFDLCRGCVDEWLTVSEAAIADAIRLIYREGGEVIEGAAGVAVAALLQTGQRFVGQTVAVVICGGNIDDGRFQEIVGAR
ncbi:MAG: threonine/serine dehydratase [Chloroflexi bacterium]|nr:threonine/serine dehydratase [Chloroflexota bacterium]